MNPELLDAARTFAAAQDDWHAGQMKTEDYEMAKSVFAHTALLIAASYSADVLAPRLTLGIAA